MFMGPVPTRFAGTDEFVEQGPLAMKRRLDLEMVARGLVPTRARAQDLIRRQQVSTGGTTAAKPGALVGPGDAIVIAPGANDYVSRGALKLCAALDAFALSPEGCVALDIGASTGGFTQVLLERGATRVHAVDVGHDQLARTLRDDLRVISLEHCDARRLTRDQLAEPIGAVTADVSFISLTLVLPHVLTFATPGAWLVALVKPQFEAGRDAVGKGGIVREAADRQRAVARVRDCVARQPGWSIIGEMPSPITGQDGNEEWLLAARRQA